MKILSLSLLSLLALTACDTTQMDVSTGNARVSYIIKPAPAAAKPAPRDAAPESSTPRPASSPATTGQNQPQITPAPQPAQTQQPALTKKPTPSSVSQNQTKAEKPVRPATATVAAQPSTNTRYATVSSRSGATTRPQQSTTRKRVLMPGQNRGLMTR